MTTPTDRTGALELVSTSDTHDMSPLFDGGGPRPSLGYGEYIPVVVDEPSVEAVRANALYAGIMAGIGAVAASCLIAVVALIV